MAIAFDASATASEVADDSPASSPLEWTHTPVGTPRAVVVHLPCGGVNTNVAITSVTYGGGAMTQVSGSPVNKATGEPGSMSAWFLGTSIPTGAQTVSVAYTVVAAGPTLVGTSITYTADDDCSIVDVDVTITSDSLENPSCTLSLGGATCACSMGFNSGQNATTGIAPLANWTSRSEDAANNKTHGVYTYDIIGSTDVTAGWTQTAEDALAIAIAIREGVVSSASFKAGHFTGPGASGNRAHTVVGFTPGATIFFANEATATGAVASDSIITIAAVDSSGASVNIGMRSDDGPTTMVTSRLFDTDPTLSQNVDGSDTTETYFDWVSNDTYGWTLNWTSTAALKVGYLAFKSTIQSKVGVLASGTSTGDISATGVGFQPDVVLFFASRGDTTEGGTAFALMGVGAMTATTQFSSTAIDEDAIGTSRVRHRAYNNQAITLINSNPNALYLGATYVSMDSDGFTINIGTAPGASTNIGYLALKGVNAHAGLIAEKTSAGTQAYTGFGFQPASVLCFGASANTNDGTLETGMTFSCGASDGTTDRAVACASVDAAATSSTGRHYSELYSFIRILGTDGSLAGSADVNSFDSDGMTLNFVDTAVSTNYQGFVAFAADAATRRYSLTLTGVG